MSDGDFIDTVSLRKSKHKVQNLDIQLKNRKLSISDTLSFTSDVPIKSVDSKLISLTEDSTSIDFDIIKNEKSFCILFQKETSKYYDLTLNESAIKDNLGYKNDSSTYSISILDEIEFGEISIIVNTDTLEQTNFILELIKKGKTIRIEEFTGEKQFKFEKLNPGDYQFRLIEDKNKNGDWDTGNYLLKMQAEPIFYHEKTLTIRANWELSETWLVTP